MLPPETVPETVTDLSGESTEFPFAVTVTVPVLVVSPDAIVNLSALDNVKSPAAAPAPAAAPTVTVTAALDTPESVAVTVDTPLLSETDDGDNASVNVGSASSSVSVNVAFDGAATPLPPEAVPETVTDLSGESTVFPFAVTVTVPVLVVSPDAIVNSSALDNVKSPETAPAPAAAATVTVTAALDTPESVAVTVDTPLLSETDDGDSTSATVGNPSSSSSVNVASDGAATLLPPETVPETVTDLSGESTVFPFAVTVTVPVLVVSPGAIVNSSALDNVKSSASAPAPAAAATVTVTASLDAPESVTVTVDTPLLSEIDDGDSASATVGSVSSSVIVNAAFDGAATPLPPETVPETVTDLSGESTEFPFAVTVTVPVLVVSPDAIVNLSTLDNVKSAATAPVPAAAATVTVTASLEAPESVAVTVDTPLLSETDDDSASVNVGSVSSSVSVKVTPEGAATLLPPETVPETVTDLSGESTTFPFAVTVTVPVLVVSPDAIVNLSTLDNVKSPAAAPAPAAAPTVTVTASLDTPESVAVTVDTPLLSEIDDDDSASVNVGSVSSSVSVKVTLDGAATLLPPETVPETVTDLSGESTEFPFAVTVTVPVLVVSPGAIVNLSALDNVKSSASAPAPAAAPTVTVTASLEAPESVAVTVDTPLLSETDDGDSTRVTVGNASSSVIVNVTFDGAATPLAPETVPETVTDLFGESTEFPTAVIVTVPVLVASPDAIVNVSALDNVKSPETAPAPAAAETVTVTAALDVPESVAVTVDTPLLSETDDGDSTRVTVGGPSSSRIVNVTLDGSATLLPPETVPETVTDLFGSSLLLSTAVIVTAPVLVVSPDAIVSVVPVSV